MTALSYCQGKEKLAWAAFNVWQRQSSAGLSLNCICFGWLRSRYYFLEFFFSFFIWEHWLCLWTFVLQCHHLSLWWCSVSLEHCWNSAKTPCFGHYQGPMLLPFPPLSHSVRMFYSCLKTPSDPTLSLTTCAQNFIGSDFKNCQNLSIFSCFSGEDLLS